MKPRRSILLVEDNDDQIGSWQADFNEFNENADAPFGTELHVAKTLEEAQRLVGEIHIDASIVDLRIPKRAGEKSAAEGGNATVHELLRAVSGPIAIFSGHTGDVEPGLSDDAPIQVFTKEASQQKAIIQWLSDQALLMTAVVQTIADIRRETARIYSAMIWRRWSETKQLNLSEDALRQVVTRQVAAHIAEQLSLPHNAPPYHPNEFYFEPPLRSDRLHTGDMLTLEDGVYVILTPQCDMVRTYPERILLAKCRDVPDWKNIKEDQLRRYAVQSHALYSHFLPPCGSRGPWLADFKNLQTVAKADAEQLLPKRFASIAAPFVPYLVQRFSAFMGRIGQPDLDVAACLPAGAKVAAKKTT